VTNATGIGPALRRARLLRNKSIEEASRETRIRAEYLQAMERERFDDLLGDVYVRGFLRTYSSYLGLDAEKVVAIYAGTSVVVGGSPRHAAGQTAPPTPPAFGTGDGVEGGGRPGATGAHEPADPDDGGDPFDGERAVLVSTVATERAGPGGRERVAARGAVATENPFRPSTAPPTFRRRRLNWPVMLGVAFAVLVILATAGLFSRAKTVPPQANGGFLPPAGEQGSGVTLSVEGTIDVRMTVQEDGQVVYHSVLRAGEGESFKGESTIEITLGRGASAHLVVNGHDLGTPGSPTAPFRATYKPNDFRRRPSPGPSVG
jgi:hypothetical protein